MVSLGENPQLGVEEFKEQLEAFSAPGAIEYLTLLVAAQEFNDLVVGSQLTSVTHVSLTAWKRCMVIVTCNPVSTFEEESPGMSDSLC